jgi:hypothetical protein
MNRTQLQSREMPAMRTFRICLDRPQPRTTILGIVGRMAADQATSGRSERQSPTQRPTDLFS